MRASASGIQFWNGIPPKIANCFTSQSIAGHRRRVDRRLFRYLDFDRGPSVRKYFRANLPSRF
jgi:hypothetical protein